ncbi:SdpI family protein [Bergeyella sp. RCAD1439]|uniref:SdpI family protein n=1 Tax=Bergeyella anatis TaxID=3113737 RepID=UPI002E179A1A|nr:SdpI family protein [Bergeyella sp. RCAD1439]
MNFENPLFLLPVLVGPIFMVSGLLLLKFPPKKINSLYGYRSKSAMKDLERWRFAQRYAGKVTTWSGLAYTSTSLVGAYTEGHEIICLAVALGLLIALCGSIFYLTERKLKERFK